MAFGFVLGQCSCRCGATTMKIDPLTGEIIWRRVRPETVFGRYDNWPMYSDYDGDPLLYVWGSAVSGYGHIRRLSNIETANPVLDDFQDGGNKHHGSTPLVASFRDTDGYRTAFQNPSTGDIWYLTQDAVRIFNRATGDWKSSYPASDFGLGAGLGIASQLWPAPGGGGFVVAAISPEWGDFGVLNQNAVLALDSSGGLNGYAVILRDYFTTSGADFAGIGCGSCVRVGSGGVISHTAYHPAVLSSPTTPARTYSSFDPDTAAVTGTYNQKDEGIAEIFGGGIALPVGSTFVAFERQLGPGASQIRIASYSSGLSQNWTVASDVAPGSTFTSGGLYVTGRGQPVFAHDGTNFYYAGPVTTDDGAATRVYARSISDGSLQWTRDILKGKGSAFPYYFGLAAGSGTVMLSGSLKNADDTDEETRYHEIVGIDASSGDVLWWADMRAAEDSAFVGYVRGTIHADGYFYASGSYGRFLRGGDQTVLAS